MMYTTWLAVNILIIIYIYISPVLFGFKHHPFCGAQHDSMVSICCFFLVMLNELNGTRKLTCASKSHIFFLLIH